MDNSHHQPGDHILDRYCPDLSSEDREVARERLRRLACVIIRIAKRLDAERAIPAGDSRESKVQGTIPSLTPDT